MKKLFIIPLVAIAFLGTAQTIEREVVSSGGDFYSNGTGQLSCTVGETVIATVANATNTLTQGFQQTKTTITGIEDLKVNFVMNVFPNPTSELLTITLEKLKKNLTYSIYTVEGKVILTNNITALETKLNIGHFIKGAYFLKVTNKKKIIKTYKILKQ